MSRISFGNRHGNLVRGHVMDVAVSPLLAALRSYDQHLYLKWDAKKRKGLGIWELRRKPEFKSVREGRVVESPKGKILVPGNIYEIEGGTLSVPQYLENHFENHVKDFERLDYRILDWVKSKDLWDHGYRGKYAVKESEYREGQYLTKIEDRAEEDRKYMIKQNQTAFNDFREYVLAGGNPDRLLDYWNKT